MLHLGNGLCSIPVDVINNRTSAVDDDGATVGRSAQCDISINQHNDTSSKFYRLISKRHALLKLTEDGLYVKDFKSKNGTFVNQIQIPSDVWFRLRENDTISLGCPARLSKITNPYSLRASGVERYLCEKRQPSPARHDSRVRDSNGGFRSWEAIKQSFLKDNQKKTRAVAADPVIDLTEDDGNRAPPAAPPVKKQRTSVSPRQTGKYMLKRPLKIAGTVHKYLEEEFVKHNASIIRSLDEDYERGMRLLVDVYGRWYKGWKLLQQNKKLDIIVENLPDGYVCRSGIHPQRHVKYPYIRLQACDHSMCLSCLYHHVVRRRQLQCSTCRARLESVPRRDVWVDDDILDIMKANNFLDAFKSRMPPESQISSMLSQIRDRLSNEQPMYSAPANDVDLPHLMSYTFVLPTSSTAKACDTCKSEGGNSLFIGIVKSPATRDVGQDKTRQTSWHHIQCLEPSIRLHIIAKGVTGYHKLGPEKKAALLKELADVSPAPQTNNTTAAMGGTTAAAVHAT